MRISDWSSDVCSSDLKRPKSPVFCQFWRPRFSCFGRARMIGVSPSPEAQITHSNADFEPHLGRLSDKGRKPRTRTFISRFFAADNLARRGYFGRATQPET